MQLLGIDHVQLAMPPGGEAEARRFYAEVLGLIEVVKPEALAARGGCWFESESTIIHLGVEETFTPARKAHPAFCVEDLEACRRKLLAAGMDVTPDESLPGVRRLYTADPFGNRVEFIQDEDGFSRRKK